MREQLVSFETAKLAKEKGFNEPCWEAYGVYSQFGDLKGDECLQTSFENELGGTFDEQDYDRDDFYLSPTQFLLQKWIREVYNLHCSVYRMNNKWTSQVYDVNKSSYITPHCYHHSYEEALEWSLREALKLIKIHENGTNIK